MYLENIVLDAVDPQRLGRFWEAALGGERLSDGPEGFETRIGPPGGPVLDLCFQPVPAPPTDPLRLHLDLRGGSEQAAVVARLVALGARPLDIGQGEVPWVVLGDPEGNPCCVLEHRAEYAATGPLAAVPLDSADPARDAEFWAWLTGWVAVTSSELAALQHPSLRGPLLEFLPERASKGAAKNRLHLDVRLETGDDMDAVAAGIGARGGRELHFDWGDLPWRHFADPSGNELCVLPAR
ncbi:MAG: VOC family protein [Jatrophihabitans sp.]|uniref:VOC family protein n=1 Tax=Jatrophihabitans sp. TaxID=1932789 RepID=UPI003F7FFFB9